MPRIALKTKPVDVQALMERAKEIGREAEEALMLEFPGANGAMVLSALYKTTIHDFLDGLKPGAVDYFTSQECADAEAKHYNEMSNKYGYGKR